MIRISKTHKTLGSEHPLCDNIQLMMIILFFVVLVLDTLGFIFFDFSTVIILLISLPVLIIPGIFFLILSLYLIIKSHNTIFDDKNNKPKFINSGVYSWVRHPMYLGILLFCFSFFFFSLSILSILIWILFFIIYEKMTAYEEKDLVRIIGKEYISYQKQVPKWILGLRKYCK